MTLSGVGLQGNNIGYQLSGFETLIGLPMRVTRHYQNYSDPLIDGDVQSSIDKGKIPLVSPHFFESDGSGVRWADVAAGKEDVRINSWATELKRIGNAPLWLVIHHEPEDDVDSIGAQGRCGTGPAEFVAAWKHTKKRLRSVGVPKTVQIGLCLMASTYKGGHGGGDLWYPTNPGPDFLATDGYNRGPYDSPPKWRSFDDIYTGAFSFSAAKGRSLVIEECGCAEGSSGQKAAWLDDALVQLRKHPQVKAFLYSHVFSAHFNCNYSLDTTPESLAAAKRLYAGLGS